jgi:pantoate ligase/cytidylate kinase
MNKVQTTTIFNHIHTIRDFVKSLQQENFIIGVVPTMGALHAGHISLIERSVTECDATIVTIFVNPAQFNSQEDLEKYPKTFETDFEICSKLGVRAIFAPDTAEMYPLEESCRFQIIPPAPFKSVLCGRFRPGHFEGVATVVTKLFNIIPADKAYFGQKDAQQLFIIKKMVEDLAIPVKIISCPTCREHDGLACSSRNVNLDTESRKLASSLYKCLDYINVEYQKNELDFVKLSRNARIQFIDPYDKICLEYLLAYNYDTLSKTKYLKQDTLVAIAANIGGVRLIDNILLT